MPTDHARRHLPRRPAHREGAIFIDAPADRSALGLKADRRHGLLFVAGGFTGEAYVYDLRTGRRLRATSSAPSVLRSSTT